MTDNSNNAAAVAARYNALYKARAAAADAYNAAAADAAAYAAARDAKEQTT